MLSKNDVRAISRRLASKPMGVEDLPALQDDLIDLIETSAELLASADRAAEKLAELAEQLADTEAKAERLRSQLVAAGKKPVA